MNRGPSQSMDVSGSFFGSWFRQSQSQRIHHLVPPTIAYLRGCDSASEIIKIPSIQTCNKNWEVGVGNKKSLLGNQELTPGSSRFRGFRWGSLWPRSLLWLYLWFIGGYGAKLPWHHWRRTWWSQIHGFEVWQWWVWLPWSHGWHDMTKWMTGKSEKTITF